MRSSRLRSRAALGLAVAMALVASAAAAQVSRRPGLPVRPPQGHPPAPPPPAAPTASNDLRSRFGLEVAMRLVRSNDADDRLRGLERIAATHTPEALTLLEHAAGTGAAGSLDGRAQLDGAARSDARAMLVVVRGLAAWTDQEPARMALEATLGAPTPSFASRSATGKDPAADEAESLARVQLARRQAALVLAETGETQALESLVAIGRAGGPGQPAALEALAMHPPSGALLGGVAVTTPGMIALAAETGDLRSLGAILGALRASDPSLRAAALAALGLMGDARVLEPAADATKDKDPRVRLAGAEALVRLAAPDAAKILEGLIADDSTALEALRIAELVRDEGVTKAAAARAAASAVPELQQAALAALGRQTSASAVTALAALVGNPRLQGDAADALARFPSTAAMAAIEALGAAPATRRLAARAYLVRRMVRGESSGRLDALLHGLESSRDGADRAVALQALVAWGSRPLDHALADPDPHVRRAAAMGSLALGQSQRTPALVARLAVENDGPTRQVLAIGLAGGDPGGAVPTLSLVDRAEAGGPDAPLAAFALARRADDELRPKVDALLASHDPVMRAHVARGLGESAAADAVGRLAEAYLWEADVDVRRALVRALAAHSPAPTRQRALELAAHLDPDRLAQTAARAALASAPLSGGPPAHDVAWVRLVPVEGAALPADSTAALVDPNGVAWPVAFDADGYALVPGVPAGEAHVRLAPRVPAYDPR